MKTTRTHTTRRKFLKTVGLGGAAVLGAAPLRTAPASPAGNRLVLDPYAGVDWRSWKRLRAQLHMHTLQSDGHHMLSEVAECYEAAGYDVLAITDHDFMEPNVHVRSGRVSEDDASPYPREPRPDNFPANTTWPWTDYGAKAPEDYGMIGIEANELTYRHHTNSYFCGVGFAPADHDQSLDDAEWNDMEIEEIAAAGGLAMLLHPGWARESHRKPLEWYADRFRNHAPEILTGIEVTNVSWDNRKYDEALWDQMLARFMPERPIWGYGTDDMHRLASARQSFSWLLAPEAGSDAVRKSMADGCLLFCRSSNDLDYRLGEFDGFDPFPEVERIDVDAEAGVIEISATGADEIQWISAPESLEATGDYKTDAAPYPQGTVVHEGPRIELTKTDGILNYVRAVLRRTSGEGVQETFTNPFGIAPPV